MNTALLVIDVQESFRHRPFFSERHLDGRLLSAEDIIARTATVLQGRFATLCTVDEALRRAGAEPA